MSEAQHNTEQDGYNSNRDFRSQHLHAPGITTYSIIKGYKWHNTYDYLLSPEILSCIHHMRSIKQWGVIMIGLAIQCLLFK